MIEDVEMPSLFENHIVARLVWVSGLMFLLLCSVFGGVSKVIYPTAVDLDLSGDIHRTVGVIQILTAALLLWRAHRRLGIALAGLNFLGWIVWFGTTNMQMVIFCLIGLVVSSMLLLCRFNFSPPEKEPEPSIEELATGSASVELDAEVEIIEDPPKASLWMDGLDKDDLLKWVFGEDK